MIVFCIADTRSGTTALARCFRNSSNFVDLGEIFYNSADGVGNYKLNWEKSDLPCLERFDEYLKSLRANLEKIYWLDIKFHDLNRFNPLQFPVKGAPRLLQRILQSHDPVVLISRANCLRAAASQEQAIRSGVFHLLKSEMRDETPVDGEYDVPMTTHTIRGGIQRYHEFHAVAGYLKMHANLFRVDYEALFDCPEADENRKSLGRWIGARTVSLPDLAKISLDWPYWFHRELAHEILKGTKYEWWVR